jgi:N utilization substance protein A
MVRLVDPEGHHAHVLVPPDQLSLAIGREGQNVRLAARLTGWKIDIKNATDYDQASEDRLVATLIAQRQEEEALQAEAEARLAAEQAARAEEDARLRELYPLPEDDEEQDGADEGQQEPAASEGDGEGGSDETGPSDAEPEAGADADADALLEDGSAVQEGGDDDATAR